MLGWLLSLFNRNPVNIQAPLTQVDTEELTFFLLIKAVMDQVSGTTVSYKLAKPLRPDEEETLGREIAFKGGGNLKQISDDIIVIELN